MKKKDDSQKSTKASVIWLSIMSTIIARLGIGIRIIRSNIRAFGKMITSLGQYTQEKRKDADNDEPNEFLAQQESENAVRQSNTGVENEALRSVAEDELMEVILEADRDLQLQGIIYRLLTEGISELGVDLTVKGRFGTVTFNCNRSQMLRLAIKLAEISPPIRLGNLDKTGCISEFREQLEMAQVLQQRKSNVMH